MPVVACNICSLNSLFNDLENLVALIFLGLFLFIKLIKSDSFLILITPFLFTELGLTLYSPINLIGTILFYFLCYYILQKGFVLQKTILNY